MEPVTVLFIITFILGFILYLACVRPLTAIHDKNKKLKEENDAKIRVKIINTLATASQWVFALCKGQESVDPYSRWRVILTKEETEYIKGITPNNDVYARAVGIFDLWLRENGYKLFGGTSLNEDDCLTFEITLRDNQWYPVGTKQKGKK